MASSTRALHGGRRLPAPLRQISGPQWLVLLIVLAGMALAGNFAFSRFLGDGAETEVGYQTGPVARRTIESAVSATGTVAATRQVRVTFPVTGQVADVHVRQGDSVTEGQPLATLDTFNLEVKRDQAQSSLATAQHRLAALLAGPTSADVAAAQQTVASAQAALTRAQNDLFTLLAGPNADEVAAARVAVERAQATLQAAQTAYDKLVSGADRTLRPEYATLQAATAAYQTALSAYTTRTAGPNPLDVATAQAAVRSAQAALDSARAKLTSVLAGPDPLEVANAQNQVRSAEAALDSARAKLGQLQSWAPANLATLEAQVTSARAALAAAEARLQQALVNDLTTYQSTPERRVDVTGARQAVAQAEAQVRTAQGNLLDAQQGPAAAELAAAQQAVTQAETGLQTARNNLAKLQQGAVAADRAAAQQAVTAAEGQLATAQNSLAKLLAGPDPADVAAAQAALDTARSNLETAQTNWDRLTSLADLETRPEYTALMTAREAYQTALTSYSTRTAGPSAGDVEVAQRAVDAANVALNSALARLAQVLGGSLPTDIGIAREAVATAELAVKLAQNDLDNAVVRAPFAGTIVSVGVNPGDQVGANTVPFTLLDPTLIRIDATVDESNVIKLKQGMPVAVTFDALQGRQFQGVVATVTPAGVAQQGVVTFPVQVVLNAQGYTIPPGTTANLRVTVESKPNVLAVPSRAIVRQGRQTFVQVLVDGEPELKPVTTGATGDNLTEIVDGVDEGEQIVVSSPQKQGQAQSGTFGTGGLPGLGTGAPGGPAQQPARR
jgi:HlyD family secretion protein